MNKQNSKHEHFTINFPGMKFEFTNPGIIYNYYLNNFIDFFCGCGGIIKDVCFTADNYNWQQKNPILQYR